MQMQKISLFSIVSPLALGPPHLHLLFSGHHRYFSQGQRGPSVHRLKLCVAIPSISPYICIAWALIQYKDNFACICCDLAALCVTLLYQGIGKLKEVQEIL